MIIKIAITIFYVIIKVASKNNAIKTHHLSVLKICI